VVDLENYMIQGEPDQRERGYIWHTAIGLQLADGLKTSDYLIATANKNINGEITLDEARKLVDDYYQSQPTSVDDKTRVEEADKVSARIASILAEKTFSFSPAEYIAIHRRLFEGIYDFAGKIRDYNISKSEWILNGESVYYASAQSIQSTLDYDFLQEKKFSYQGLSMTQIVKHLARFTSGLWQIHAFGEGNTRTIAVFVIKYLRTFGFDVTNDIFAENAWYFRNALVRANYNNLRRGIHETYEYLDRFFANLLSGEKNSLENHDLLLSNESKPIDNVPINVPINLTENQLEVLLQLKESPHATALHMAGQIGVSDKTIKRALADLKSAGLIKRVGSNKAGYWIVNQNFNV